MNALTPVYQKLGKITSDTLVENLYSRILSDYRICRLFSNTPEVEQTAALKKVIDALGNGAELTDENFLSILDDYFMAAFSRSKRKSFVNGTDFGFFGYIIEQDQPSKLYLCDSHAQLLRFMPDDANYDVLMEHLAAVLQALSLEKAIVIEVLNCAERARKGILGKA